MTMHNKTVNKDSLRRLLEGPKPEPAPHPGVVAAEEIAEKMRSRAGEFIEAAVMAESRAAAIGAESDEAERQRRIAALRETDPMAADMASRLGSPLEALPPVPGDEPSFATGTPSR